MNYKNGDLIRCVEGMGGALRKGNIYRAISDITTEDDLFSSHGVSEYVDIRMPDYSKPPCSYSEKNLYYARRFVKLLSLDSNTRII